VNNGTTFLDGSSLNGGTTYYAAFELTGGDASDSTALVTRASISGGGPVHVASEPVGYVREASRSGRTVPTRPVAFQNAGTLQTGRHTGNSYSQYAQAVSWPGRSFPSQLRWTAFTQGGIPDEFSFQMYDSTLSTELYEQDLDILSLPPSLNRAPWSCVYSLPDPHSKGCVGPAIASISKLDLTIYRTFPATRLP